jgi:hypothetical protein
LVAVAQAAADWLGQPSHYIQLVLGG